MKDVEDGKKRARIRSLVCGFGRPLGARLFPKRFAREMVVHCLLVETSRGLALVDSGLSRAELQDPRRLGVFARTLGLVRAPELAAAHQIERFGFRASDVRDIVLTHLDLDHAGGVADFPHARVHVSKRAARAARSPRRLSERLRTRRAQWESAKLVEHDCEAGGPDSRPEDLLAAGTNVLVEDGVRLRLVPLPGHVRGHCGVLVETPGEIVLHVGDAYYVRSELDGPGSFPFQLFKRTIDEEPRVAEDTRVRLSELCAKHPDVRLVSSHDPSEVGEPSWRAARGA